MTQPDATSSSTETSPRLLVVGSGGIGGVVAAHLFHLGANVTLLTRDDRAADAINDRGLVVRGENALGHVTASATSSLPAHAGPFDFIILATQPPEVEAAARSVLPHLAEHGALICLQNGLCEVRLAELAGASRVMGAIVAWGASMLEPGVYDRTSAGGFVLGRLDGTIDERLVQLGNLLEAVGPVTLSTNLLGARWSKLALNCAVSSLGTIGGERLGPLLKHRFVRRLALETMTEAVAVAHAESIVLEKVSGTLDLEWVALTAEERLAKLGSPALVAKHALLLAVGTRYRRLRSSMLSAIERGRTPAVDFLNGEVVTRGAQHGIATPINSAIREAVWEIAQGRLKPSSGELEALYVRTRKHFEATPIT